MEPDVFWIPGPWLGSLAIVARPLGGDWLVDEARAWQRAGINVVVSLLEENESLQLGLTDEAAAALANGIRFISFPIPDRDVPASAPAALALMCAISDELQSGKNVALHCRQSVGRSGLIAAGVLAASGIDPVEAMKRVSSARGQTVPETADQDLWIRHLPVAAR